MADRLTELQDTINLQAENLGNAIGVIQQLAQPSFFRELNHNGRREKEWASNPEFQAILQNQSQEGITRSPSDLICPSSIFLIAGLFSI